MVSVAHPKNRWRVFGLFFVFGFFPDLGGLTEAMETVVVLLFPLWMLLFGWQLLRWAVSSTASAVG